MSRKYKIHDQQDLQFLTYAVVDWVDALSRPVYKDIVVDSLKHCQQNKGLKIYAWCIMSNHVHLIAKAAEGTKLQDILRDYKKFTSKSLVAAIKNNGQESRKEWMLEHFVSDTGRRPAPAKSTDGPAKPTIGFWQPGLHPIWLRTPSVIEQKLNYVHNNPVVEGLVRKSEDYVYSSAGAYAGLPMPLLEVEIV